MSKGGEGGIYLRGRMELCEIVKPEEIEAAVGRLASSINRDYRDLEPVMVGILKGSFIFMADLVRQLEIPVEIEFIRASSYGSGKESTGEVAILKDLEMSVKGRDVILVEDIIDTGRTLAAILRHVSEKMPRSVKVCTLLSKPARRVMECPVDYVGLEIEDRFLVGYGLDCAEKYRNLKGLYELRECAPN